MYSLLRLFYLWGHGEWTDLFVPHSDSFLMNPEKKTLTHYIDSAYYYDPF